MPEADAARIPLTPPEFGIWLISEKEPEAFNLHRLWELRGPLDVGRLRTAVEHVVGRHPVFARRLAEGDVPTWTAGEAVPAWHVEHLDTPHGYEDGEDGKAAVDAEVTGWQRRAGAHRFDLSRDCPVRVGLLRRGPRHHLLSLLVHHVACDGVALETLIGEIGARYAESLDDADTPPAALSPAPLPPPPAQAAPASGYWPAHLAEARWPETLPPAAGPRTCRADVLRLPLAPEETALVRAAARGLRATPHLIGLAALYATLAVHGSAHDAMVATPFAARTPETMQLVACLARMVPLRLRWAPGDSGADLVEGVRRTVTEALTHSAEPIREASELFDPATTGTTVCFQAHGRLPDPALPGVDVVPLDDDAGRLARFDLEIDLHLRPDAGAVVLTLRAAGGTTEEGAARLLHTYRRILLRIARDPEQTLALADAADPGTEAHGEPESSLLLAPPRQRPARPLMDRFAELVRTAPDRPAVADRNTTATFGELGHAVTRLAATLAGHGAGPGLPVAVLAERGTPLVAAVLAVWRLGGHVVLLDPLHPDSRLAHVVADSRARVLLRSPGLHHRLPGHPDVVELAPEPDTRPPAPGEEPPAGPAPYHPRALAYVIHTSGTTGQPKGVMVDQGVLATMFEAQPAGLGISRIGLTCAVSFDVFFHQLLYLFRGCCLVMAEDAVYRDPQALVSWTERRRVEFLSITPSMLGAMRQFGFEETLARTRTEIELAGEAVDQGTWELLRRLGVRATNSYGPTETIVVTACDFAERDTPSIGGPVAGTSAYVLGPGLRPVPPGVAGELYIGGPQVSRGYLGKPGLTADRFLPDPFSGEPGARMYRTGDRVRLTDGGRLDYLRRVDHQLKVRGQRVDPYEVEDVLRRAPGVRDAYVARGAAAHPSGLRAYVVPEDPADPPAVRRIRAVAAEQLPPAAVPTHVTVVTAFPMTPNGKLDEQALPQPVTEPADATGAGNGADPVARLWSESTGLPPASEDDNFFECGGSSLDAARVVAALNRLCAAEIDLASFLRDPTPFGLRHQLRNTAAPDPRPDAAPRTPSPHAAAGAAPAAPPAPTPGLSDAQRRLLLAHRAAPGSNEFTVFWALRPATEPEPEALERAWREVVTAHPELRLRVTETDGRPVRAEWPVEDFPVHRRTLGPDELDGALAAAADRAFDPLGEPLIRLETLSAPGAGQVLLFTAHHLVLDRHSIQLINARLISALAGTVPPVPGHRYTEAGEPAAAEADRAREFWAGELDRVSTAPPIDLGAPEPGLRDTRGTAVHRTLDGAAWKLLQETARARRTTPLVLAMAAFALTADRHGAAGDVLVGTSMDVRPPGFDDVVGLFVNPVPVRLRFGPGLTGDALIGTTHEALLRAHDHRRLPFNELVRHLGLRSEPGAAPLFQVLVDYEPLLPADGGTASDRAWEPVDIPGTVAKYDLEVMLRQTADGGRLTVNCRTDRWRRSQAARIADQVYEALLRLATDSARPAAEPLTAAAGELGPGDGAEPSGPGGGLVGGLVAGIALREPDRVAVVSGEHTLTYGTLRSAALAAAARLAAAGVRRGDRVAVLARRGADMAVAVLGAVFAGAAYVPLDPGHPDARITRALHDSGAAAVLATGDCAARARRLGATVVDPAPDRDRDAVSVGDRPVPAALRARDQAYVIYTSGSTGEPKGVVVEHGSLAASTDARRAVYPGRPVFLLVSPLAFDSSAAGLWGTLTAGGRLVVADDDEVRDPERLIGLVERHQVTRLLCVPSLHAVLLRTARHTGAGPLRSLREVVVAGEPLPDRLQEQHFALLPGVPLVNEYGPTEAAVWSSYRRYHAPGPAGIGGPVPGYRLYVLDHALRPVPPGAPGELHVGGPGVARGYLGRAAATAAAFLPDPFAAGPGARMYRTGDRVRRGEDGTLVFLGRTDDQIKVRGHRIQPGEVEEVLRALDGVEDAAVVARDAVTLVAFLTGRPPAPDQVRRALAATLPGHLVPAAVHVVDRLPRTANGKVDRRELRERAAAPAPAPVAADRNRTGPARHAEVAGAWSEVLGVADVPDDVNFFDLGGHSLLVPALQEALHRRTGVRLTVLDLFRHATVADTAARLAERAAEAGGGADPGTAPVRDGGAAPAPDTGADTAPDTEAAAGATRRAHRAAAARRLRDRRTEEADR
ncbi:amino acid adenylation domain-containing protein [Streptomyces fradiae]|uniref:amino acid adenylation domain-containing protein n=1 Tax=Streptomyces fradiae TaxID=1906 RepID=UPI00351973C8